MSDLTELYNSSATIVSDINEHVPTLRKYASECSSVAELGVRSGVSTFGWLKGLTESPAETKSYYGVDIDECPITVLAKNVATSNGIDYTFVKGDSAKVDLPNNVDLLFIDTWHVYGHLKRELAKHHEKVLKYIVLHDTTVDEWKGESIRCDMNVKKQAEESGYPEEEITKGLWPAVEEFLKEHEAEWKLHERFTNNNGLTILKRVSLLEPEVKGSPSYSLPTKDNYPIDWKVAEALDKYGLLKGSSTMFYVEAGANDGVTQSNTMYLEQCFGWRGLLVEPCLQSFEKCKRFRGTTNICVSAALVATDNVASIEGDFYAEADVIDYTSLMSSVGGKMLDRTDNLVSVPARTLTSLVNEHNISAIDFMSLDVEGYEISVLQGIDLDAPWAPKVFLIEVHGAALEHILALLHAHSYVFVENLSGHAIMSNSHSDLLFVKKSLLK